MAKRVSPTMGGEGHLESDAEYTRRVQEEIDRGQWQGHVSVCDDFPKRAIVHEMTPLDEETPPHVYRWRK